MAFSLVLGILPRILGSLDPILLALLLRLPLQLVRTLLCLLPSLELLPLRSLPRLLLASPPPLLTHDRGLGQQRKLP